MRYNYICNDCSTEKKPLVFETEHGMNEKPKVKCPRCENTNTEVTWIGVEPAIMYVRGYGWLDRKGRRRDMNLYKLQNDDPYASMRQVGEKEDLEKKIKSGGHHNPKPIRFHMGRSSKKKKSK